MPLLFTPETSPPYSALPNNSATRTNLLNHSPCRIQEEWRLPPPLRIGKHAKVSAGTSLLDKLLIDPFPFTPATSLTARDEMAVLRSHKLLSNSSDPHRVRRRRVNKLPKSTWPVCGKQAVGFHNPHNYCYRRSVMQSLVHIPRLDDWLQHSRRLQNPCHKPLQASNCLLCAFTSLVRSLREDSANIDRCVAHVDAAIRLHGNRSGYSWTANARQADANEVLLFLVEQFQERFNYPPKIIESLFKLVTTSQWKCRTCAGISTSGPFEETCISLSIQDENAKDKAIVPTTSVVENDAKNETTPTTARGLEHYLRQYFTDMIPGVDCQNCLSRHDRTRKIEIVAAPEVLFIQLKRFMTTPDNRQRKINKKVRIPHFLHLGQFTRLCSKEAKHLVYKLVSVVAHSGTLSSGHYTCYAQRADGSYWKYDDSKAIKSSLKKMLDPGDGFTPYILTYVLSEGRVTDLDDTHVDDTS